MPANVFLSGALDTCWVLVTKQPLTLLPVIPLSLPPSDGLHWVQVAQAQVPGRRFDQLEYGISLVTVIGLKMITSSNQSQ